MSKKTVLAATMLIVLMFVTSCQPTPDAPIVQSKNNGELQEKVYGEPAPLGKYEAPTEWVEQFDGKGTIYAANINAKINIPDTEAYPVYRVSPEKLTQEKADEFLNYFIGDEELYFMTDPYQRTKDQIMEEILSWQEMMEKRSDPEYDTFSSDEEREDYMQMAQASIKGLQQLYKSAPTEIEMEKVSRQLSENPILHYFGLNITGYTKDKNTHVDIRVSRNPDEVNQGRVIKFYDKGAYYIHGSKYATGGAEDLEGAKYSYEQALSVAQKLVSDFGYDYILHFSYVFDDPSRAIPVEGYDTDVAFYNFRFSPCVDGNKKLPMLHYPSPSDTTSQVAIPWDQPYIDVSVEANSGVAEFAIWSSIQFNKKLNENVSLLPFEEIQDIAREYLVLSPNRTETIYEEGFEPLRTILNINEICLGYIKISEKDSIENGLCLPVWMFYGNQTDEFIDQEHSHYVLDDDTSVTHRYSIRYPILCINAIDGSIIDLRLGY